MISPRNIREDFMSRKNKSTTQAPTSDSQTTTTEQPAPTQSPEQPATEGQPSFAERVGKSSGITIPDPFGIAGDYLADVKLFESKRDRQVAIQFGEGRLEDKPSPEVIGKLKEAGYRWNQVDKIWAYPIEPASAMSTRITAEKLFKEVSQMIRKEKGLGIESPEEQIPF
jgi:hypothetical protein